jgi:hypothetical protein
MKSLNIIRLDLCAPLYYSKNEELRPFEYLPSLEEMLCCFEIAPDQCLNFEPDHDLYLGTLVFAGEPEPQSALSEQLALPEGKYLFAQQRELLSREAIIQMAIEIQKEGLWERLSLENTLYLRYLFEDGTGVTQIFRPYSEDIQDKDEE